MKSMTGFGYAQYQDDKCRAELSLKSYNNRFLDIFVYLPASLGVLEQRVREYLGTRILRGRVELTLRITEFEENPELILDQSTVTAYVKALEKLKQTAGLEEPLRINHLLRLEGVLKLHRRQDVEGYWQLLMPLLEAAYGDFEQMRIREGQATRKDVVRLLAIIEANIDKVAAQAETLEVKIREGLRAKFHELLGNEIDEARVLAETAVTLARFDINEELVRLGSHLSHFRNVLAKEDGAMGKKLDFICQELNREVNTIGSKSTLLEVDRAVVSFKDALEKIREQLRNVE